MKTIILILLFLLTTCMANMPNNCKKLWDIKENKQTVMIYMCIEQPESLLTPTIITNTSNNNTITNIVNNTNVTNITNVNDIISSITTHATTTTQAPTTTHATTTLAATTTQRPTTLAATTTTQGSATTTTQGIAMYATTTQAPTTTKGTATLATTTNTQKPVPVIATTRAPTTQGPTTLAATTTLGPATLAATTTQKPAPVVTTTQKPVPVIDPVVSTTTKLRGQGNINSNLNNNIVQNKEPSKEKDGLSQTTQTLIIVFSGITIVSVIGAVTYSCKNKKEPITPNQSNQRMLDNRYSPGRGTNPNIQQQTNTIHPRRLQHMNSWYNNNNDIRKLSTQMKKKRKNKKTNDKVEHSKTHPGENDKNDKSIPKAPSSRPPPLPNPTLHDREQDLRQFLKTDISLQNPRTKLNKNNNSIPTDDKSSKKNNKY